MQKRSRGRVRVAACVILRAGKSGVLLGHKCFYTSYTMFNKTIVLGAWEGIVNKKLSFCVYLIERCLMDQVSLARIHGERNAPDRSASLSSYGCLGSVMKYYNRCAKLVIVPSDGHRNRAYQKLKMEASSANSLSLTTPFNTTVNKIFVNKTSQQPEPVCERVGKKESNNECSSQLGCETFNKPYFVARWYSPLGSPLLELADRRAGQRKRCKQRAR